MPNTFQCWIPGKIPSKKNGKMLTRGRTITAPATQQALQSFVLILQAERSKQDVFRMTDCEIIMKFYLSAKRSDLDNGITSILDCLKNADVIANDSAKHVIRLRADVVDCEAGEEGCAVAVISQVGKLLAGPTPKN